LIEYFNNLLLSYDFDREVSLYLAYCMAIVLIILIIFIVDLLSKRVFLRLVYFYIKKSKSSWDDVLLQNHVFDQLARIPAIIVIYIAGSLFPAYQSWIQRIAFCFIIFLIIKAVSRLIDSANDIYAKYEISKERPIKGYLQGVKIFLIIMAGIIILSIIIDRSPWILLSGLGAATAVLLLIFQNSILGLVASIQLSANDMVKIGDWIEMPSHGADGNVIDISLHTVKVQNWDKTIVTIPTHALISESFKNWKGVKEAGGRRIKRSVYIDMTTVKFCDDKMLDKFKRIQFLADYIDERSEEIEQYNKEHNIDTDCIVNGRRMTNIGCFRMYLLNYLKSHPKINRNMTIMVRQLQPDEKGIPIEIYAFAGATAWDEYEQIQSDIFDHIMAIVPEFELALFQSITGNDLRRMGEGWASHSTSQGKEQGQDSMLSQESGLSQEKNSSRKS